MPGPADSKNEFSIDDIENWNVDRTVDAPVMLIGAMGKSSAVGWVYLQVSANGNLISA